VQKKFTTTENTPNESVLTKTNLAIHLTELSASTSITSEAVALIVRNGQGDKFLSGASGLIGLTRNRADK
jgi:hypothetical protein